MHTGSFVPLIALNVEKNNRIRFNIFATGVDIHEASQKDQNLLAVTTHNSRPIGQPKVSQTWRPNGWPPLWFLFVFVISKDQSRQERLLMDFHGVCNLLSFPKQDGSFDWRLLWFWIHPVRSIRFRPPSKTTETYLVDRRRERSFHAREKVDDWLERARTSKEEVRNSVLSIRKVHDRGMDRNGTEILVSM